MGYPVKGVTASAGDEELTMEPLGDRKRKFRLDLPEAGSGKPLEVYLFAGYDRGDGFFAIKIASRSR